MLSLAPCHAKRSEASRPYFQTPRSRTDLKVCPYEALVMLSPAKQLGGHDLLGKLLHLLELLL